MVGSVKSRTRCWTDASFEPGPPFPKMRMCAIVANDSSRVGIVVDAPLGFFEYFEPRFSHISVGELFAVMIAFYYMADAFKDTSAICYVDNVGVIHTIVNGASSQVDLGALTHGLHFRLAQLRASVWWEYVPSPSNIADGGSRVGIGCPLAKIAGISLSEVSCAVLPLGFPFCRPSEWSNWWPQ